MVKLEWEKLNDKYEMERARVLEGWLVYSPIGDYAGLTFVPDPNHEWQ